jgi:hypothetical protein
VIQNWRLGIASSSGNISENNTTDNGSVVFWILVNLVGNGYRFLVTVNVVLKEAFKKKGQKTIDDFFKKMQRNEALNIELMDKYSQYTFIYVK